MTATLPRTKAAPVEAPAEPEVTVTVPPEPKTLEVPSGVLTAADEAALLRKYKRLVRAESLKAQADMGWCQSGTNERLERLGVRLIGEGVGVRIEVTATRTMYLKVDADSKEEAEQMVADSEPDVVATARTHLGAQFTVVGIKVANQDEAHIYAAGDPDNTLAADGHPRRDWCSETGAGYYCTRRPGHTGNHAAGNGSTISYVWN